MVSMASWTPPQRGGRGGGGLRHPGEQGGRDRGALQRLAGKGQGGTSMRSRKVSVNLFPENEAGRRMSRVEPPAMSASPAPSMVMGDEVNPFSASVNPFWSDEVRRQVMDGIEEKDEQKEDASRVPTQAGLTKTDIEELERIKREGLREIEQRMMEEVRRRSEASSASYRTLPTVQDAELGKGIAEVRNGLGGAETPIQTPPGIPNGWVTGGQRPQGEALTESLRNLELPKLGPVSFGDWMAIVGPLMADISSTSSVWWSSVLRSAEDAYQRWLTATPLQRLRLRVVPEEQTALWPRTAQRAITMLLTAIPEEVRCELISSRKLDVAEIVFKLFTVFQPGGPQERAQLLKEVSDDRLSQTASAMEVLRALRQWRRNVARAIELQLQLPDPVVLTHVLSRWSEHVGRVGGHQVAYRVASLRQILMLDQRPTLAQVSDQVSEFAEALQAEAEQLVLAMTNPGLAGGNTDGGRKKDGGNPNALKAAALQAGQVQRDGREGGDPKGSGREKPKCKF